ncbi:MAG: peptidase M14 [Ignavibacteriales bacterium]|nr:MAG: peptidase M14 [Ignavibacteriales bacterium]
MISLKEAANIFYQYYDRYMEPSLKTKWVRHSDIQPLIQNLPRENFDISAAGKSVLEKDICLLSWGKGPRKIFLWSQMHGDESTATKALFDIFNFLSSSDELDAFRNILYEKNTLYFLPLLNPDGAEYFNRRNSFDIDLNRDALSLQSPESKLLKFIFDEIKPDFGFNLHDQDEKYSVGNTKRQAAISFLAPPADFSNSVSPNRERAMQLIAGITAALSDIIPGHIARYSDEFEPRAFGDNFQKWGMSTVLVESGGWKDDEQKQFIRKLNFVLLLTAFDSITSSSYLNFETDDYLKIPENTKYLMNVVLRNLWLKINNHRVKIDIGINREQLWEEGKLYYKSTIEEIGDLSVYSGIEDHDFTGYEVLPGKISDKVFESVESLRETDKHNLLRQGITDVRISKLNTQRVFTDFTYNLRMKNLNHDLSNHIKVGEGADLIIIKNDEVKFIIINGFIYNIETNSGVIQNSIVKHV